MDSDRQNDHSVIPAKAGIWSDFRCKGTESFTLVELLIVIAILAVLAAAVVVVLNPAELLAQARDSQRVTDMKTMKDAIDLWTVDNPSVTMGVSQTVYISIPDTSTTCSNITGLPSLPAGWAYHCVTTSNSRNIDGTGWIPLNFTTVKGGSPVPYLPLDPQNDASLTKYYSYIPGGSYVLTALMESEKQGKTSLNDGGTDPGRLEVGTDLNLWATASREIGYWNFDEGSGTTVNSAIGSLSGTVTGATWIAGKKGTALGFAANAVDSVSLPNTLVNGMNDFTISAWIYLNGTSGTRSMLGGANAALDNEFMMRATANKISAYMKGAGDYAGQTSLTTGRWYHFIFTRSGGTARLYLDGRLDYSGTLSSAAMIVDPGGLIIGQEQDSVGGSFDSGQAWNGRIDEMRFFSRSITSAEALAIYNGEK